MTTPINGIAFPFMIAAVALSVAGVVMGKSAISRSSVPGARGETGQTGAQGAQGATGPQGIQGNTGPQGVRGEKGSTGPRGEAGVSFTGPTGGGGFLAGNLPTIINSVPLWGDTGGSILNQQTTSTVGFFNGPITSAAGRSDVASGNVYFGAPSLTSTTGAAGAMTTSGSNNTAYGAGALRSVTTATGCVAVGRNAMAAMITEQGVGVGCNALMTIQTGGYCTAVGTNALRLTTGRFNTAMGQDAGMAVTSGVSNTLLGSRSGWGVDVGSRNTMVGDMVRPGATLSSGDDNTTVGYNNVLFSGNSGNVCIGSGANNGAVGDNCTVIGFGAQATVAAQLVLRVGNSNTTTFKSLLTTTASFTNGGGAALQAPAAFWSVNIGGTDYVIPLFTP